MSNTRPYVLFCPIEPAIHPEHVRAEEESTAWVLQHAMVRPGPHVAALRALRIPEFVSRAYPHAQYEDLRIVMDWTMWGFLADDQHDQLVDKPELLRARYLEHVEVLENGLADHVTGMHQALGDLRTRIHTRGGPGCLRRFTEASSDWFESMHEEIRNRVRVTPPSLLDYLRLREVTVGMYTEYALLDVTHQVRTTDSFWIEPDVRRLAAMAANIIGWANDVFSYGKERNAGDPHNMVLLFSAEQGLSTDEAVARTVVMHDREMMRFLELTESVRRSRWISTELIEPFLDLLFAWIRGNIDWAVSSDRYGLVGAQVASSIPSPSARPGGAPMPLASQRADSGPLRLSVAQSGVITSPVASRAP